MSIILIAGLNATIAMEQVMRNALYVAQQAKVIVAIEAWPLARLAGEQVCMDKKTILIPKKRNAFIVMVLARSRITASIAMEKELL